MHVHAHIIVSPARQQWAALTSIILLGMCAVLLSYHTITYWTSYTFLPTLDM